MLPFYVDVEGDPAPADVEGLGLMDELVEVRHKGAVVVYSEGKSGLSTEDVTVFFPTLKQIVIIRNGS